MAKMKLNPIIEDLRGSLNDVSFRRMYGMLTLMKKPDMSNVVWSEAQKLHREHFREAAIYAREAMEKPDVQAHYQALAQQTGKRPRDLAVSDYFRGIDLLNPKP